MSRERFARAREIFDAACDLPPAERAAFLRERCGEDADLLSHVQRLLRFSESPSAPLDADPLRAPFRTALDAVAPAPAKIGPFRVLGLIGRGGMGEVYEAEQEHPRRRVAIKVLRAGALTPQLLRRFELEAQVLGRLQHPGIACIHEAGVRSVDGHEQPYIVMELVRGRPLDVFAEARPPVRTVLELFASICDAMDHAHRAGVVHRDLKPSNILIDASGKPRIVDFGVARLVDAAESMRTLHTVAGQLVGTLAYMSPEQISGGAHEADARSDVYSLGVILFELLAGRPPLDVRGRSLPDIARMIREHDPTTLGAVDPALRGDLDTITAKALEKEPSRRYPSAGELGADIRRFLRDEPIAARPPTATYQLKKFARRHRELVSGLAATFAVLAISLVAVSWLALREAHHRALAEERAVRARWESYRNCIAAADRSLRLKDAPRALQLLDSAPESVRGWEWRYLRRLADPSTLTVSLPGVSSAVVARGGAIWAGAADGVIIRMDPRTGRTLGTHRAPGDSVASLGVSTDGRSVVSCSSSGAVGVWDARGELLWQTQAAGLTHEQAFFPDGSRIAVPLDRRIGFLDVATGQELDALKLPVQSADRPTVDPTGRRLVCRLGPVIVCFDVGTREELWRIEGMHASFSADGTLAITYGGGPAGVIVVDAATGRVVLRREQLAGLPLGAPGRWVAAHAGSSVELFDSFDGEPRLTLPGHRGRVNSIFVVPGSTSILTSAADGTAKLWDTRALADACTIPPSNDAVLAGAISPDGRWAATVGWGAAKLWDLATSAEEWTSFPTSRELHAAAFSPDGARLAIAGSQPGVIVLDVVTGRVLGTVPTSSQAIRQVAWIDDETCMCVGADDRWHILRGPEGSMIVVQTGEIETGGVIATGGPDGLIAATGEHGHVALGKPGSPEPLQTDDGPPGTALAFQRGGRCVVRGSEDGTVAMWEIPTGTRRWRVGALGAGEVASLAFTPDGTRLAVGFASGTVHLLDVESGDTLLELRAAPGSAADIGFTPDGQRIAVLSVRPGGCRLFEVSPSPEQHASRALQAQARTLVDALTPKFNFAREIAEAAATTRDVPEEVRALASTLATVRGDHANQLNSQAWAVVRFPNRTPEEYALAVAKAEHACRVMPDSHGFHNTLGVALLRAGRLDEAVAALEACLARPRPQGVPPHPADLLPLAIARARQGRPELARAHLEAARESLKHYAPDPEYEWLASEAAAAIGHAPAPP